MNLTLLSLIMLLVALPKPVVADEAVACQVQARFPQGGSLGEVVSAALRGARSRVIVALYGFNNSALADELVKLAQRQIIVEVKIDAEKYRAKKTRRLIDRVKKAGVRVQAVAPDGRNHNKFAVIDGTTVLTGSYNWTVKAESNFENLLVLNCPPIAQQYEREWQRIR